MSTSVTIDAVRARYLADAVLPAMSKDDLTPVICGALWTFAPDADLEVLATDRYRVHRVREADTEVAGEGGSFIVPRDAIVWLRQNANYYGRRGRSLVNAPQVVLEFAEGVLSIEVREDRASTGRSLGLRVPLTKGNFPPVARLFEVAEKAEATVPERVKLDFLIGAERVASEVGDQPAIKYTVGEGSKPGPMLLKFRRGEVLVQPNLRLS